MLNSEVIFHNTSEDTTKKVEGFDGDSGVGQASEFPSKSLTESNISSMVSQKGVPKPRFSLLSSIGTILIIISLVGFFITYGQIIKVELGYRLSRALSTETPPVKGSFSEMVDKTFLGETEGVPDPEFSLIIPKIHAKGKIVADVDPSSNEAYMEALKSGIAHAKGSKLPGETGNIYLFAHSTDDTVNVMRFNAVFYLLRELERDDEVQIYFHGVKHVYRVTDTQIVEPTDVSFLTAENLEEKEQLILQTCYPPGTTWKRLLVFGEKK